MSTRNPASPRRYGDDEVRQLLERATRLQQAGEPEHSEEGVTLAELEEAAAEVGIRTRYIRRAAALSSNPGAKPRFAIFGRQSPHRSIQGEIGDEDWKSLTVEIERFLGRGTVTVMSGSAGGFAGPCKALQWLSANRRTWICIASGAGKTEIWVKDYLADLLGSGIGGVAAGVFIALSIDGGFLGPGGALLFGALLGWGTALLLKLGFMPMLAGMKRSEGLETLVERVVNYTQPEYERLGE
ncbi:MAG: hypothetical protein OXF01_12705 [Gemmatimonadetes bacterium]|nr:hypothetical protein [Gemmatimonadota bacterium]